MLFTWNDDTRAYDRLLLRAVPTRSALFEFSFVLFFIVLVLLHSKNVWFAFFLEGGEEGVVSEFL